MASRTLKPLNTTTVQPSSPLLETSASTERATVVDKQQSELAKLRYTVTFGGWFQRTTLHLSEIYAFLAECRSQLALQPDELRRLHGALKLTAVSRESGYLEYILVQTESGITLRYYEDGLYVLEVQGSDIALTKKLLEDYFSHIFDPAIRYLFSLGAPTPKILANIKTAHPVVVYTQLKHPAQYIVDAAFGKVYSQVTSEDISVFKTHEYIFVVSDKDPSKPIRELVEMQIFFREFKDQLEKYLNIHRKIWEEIDVIAEQRSIRGKDVAPLRQKLNNNQKTISLITNRINQMGSYVHTRASIAQKMGLEDHLSTLFQYKFDVLSNTLDYIKEVWSMTRDYLGQALSLLGDIEGRTRNSNITSLRTITTIGVITGILSWLQQPVFPVKLYTTTGIRYFLFLFVVTFIINFAVGQAYKMVKYKLQFAQTDSKI